MVIAGFTALLPLGLVFLPTDKAESQASCGVQDPNIGRYPAPPYYYDPNQSLGCSPAIGGGWHRYYGTPSSTGIWGIQGTSIRFQGAYVAYRYSEIQPAPTIKVTPVRVSIRRR